MFGADIADLIADMHFEIAVFFGVNVDVVAFAQRAEIGRIFAGRGMQAQRRDGDFCRTDGLGLLFLLGFPGAGEIGLRGRNVGNFSVDEDFQLIAFDGQDIDLALRGKLGQTRAGFAGLGMRFGFLHDARRSDGLHRLGRIVSGLLFELVGAFLRFAQLGFFFFDLGEFLGFFGIGFRRFFQIRLHQTGFCLVFGIEC